MDAQQLEGEGRHEPVRDGHSGDGDRREHPGLPVWFTPPVGGEWHPDLQLGEIGEVDSPVRVQKGDGATGHQRQDQADRNDRHGGELRVDNDGALGYGERVSEEGLRRGGEPVDTELPSVANGRWSPPASPVASDAETGLRDPAEVLEEAAFEDFSKLTLKAVGKLKQILNIKVSDTDIRFLQLQKDAAVAVLGLAMKADEARFRARSEGGLVAILEEVKKLRSERSYDILDDEFSKPASPLLQ